MKLRRVTVRIARHAGVDIEKVVPAWEVRVLNAIFDEPNVVQVGSESYEGDFNARDEYETLLRRYGTATDSEGDKIISKAYRDAYELEQAVIRMRAVWDAEDMPPPGKKHPAEVADIRIP